MKRFYRLAFWQNGCQQQIRWFVSPRKMRRYWQNILSCLEDAQRYDGCDIMVYTESVTGECVPDIDHRLSEEFWQMLDKAKSTYLNS